MAYITVNFLSLNIGPVFLFFLILIRIGDMEGLLSIFMKLNTINLRLQKHENNMLIR